jgi:hypothetical protein
MAKGLQSQQENCNDYVTISRVLAMLARMSPLYQSLEIMTRHGEPRRGVAIQRLDLWMATSLRSSP